MNREEDTASAMEVRPLQAPAPALLMLWGITWGAFSIARLIDGGRMMVYSDYQILSGPLHYAEAIAGLAIAATVVWAGSRAKAGAGGKVVIGALGAFVLHRALISLHWDAEAWLRIGISSGVLPDVVCAGALMWFIYRTSVAPEPADRKIPCVVDLALLVLIGRDGLRVFTPPVSFDALDELPRLIATAPLDAGFSIVGMLLGMLVLALALARIAGARIIAPATSTLLGLSMFYALILMGVREQMGSDFVPGVATSVSLYVLGVTHLVERGMLISAVKGKRREKEQR